MRITEKLALKVLAAFALVLIPIAAAGYTGYIENQKIVTEHSLEGLALVAEAKEGQVYGFIENMKGRALDFSSDGLVRDTVEAMLGLDESDPLYTEKQRELSEHLRQHKMPLDENVHQIAVLDPGGRIIAASDKRDIGKDESDADYFIQGQNGAYASDVHVSPHLSLSEHPYYLAVSAPLTSRKTGEVLGVLVNYYDTSGLNKVLGEESQMEEGTMRRVEAGASLDIYLVNGESLLITPSKFSEGVLEQRIDTSLVLGCAEGKESSGAYSNYMGMRVFGASACISSRGWTILVEEPEESALAPLAPLRQRAATTIVLEICLLTGLLLLYWRGTISSVIKLSEAAKKVKSGDLTVRADVKSKDEIGTLASDFNSMVEALGTSQKEIKKARDHLKRVINSTKDSILVIDGDYTIIDANPAALASSGSSREDYIGRKCYEANHRKDTPCEDVLCPVKEIFEKGEPRTNVIHEHFDKDGNVRIVDITASPINAEEGNVTGVVEISRDITKRKKAEEELKKAYEELKVIDDTKTNIISNVKHELRTPITIARPAIELAIDEEDHETREKMLKAASRALTRQDRIIGDLIETLEIKTHEKVKLEEPVDMVGVINFVTSEFEELITTKKIDFVIEIEDDLPMALANQKDVVHILRNILDNAIKFTDDGGEVKIVAKKKGADEVEVSILDSGIGISKDIKDKIFEDLFQGDASTTRKYSGTGLGLSVVRNLIEFYGGKIELWSEEGEGTEFCFTLPRALEG